MFISNKSEQQPDMQEMQYQHFVQQYQAIDQNLNDLNAALKANPAMQQQITA
jgi:hypothetical protein